MTKCPFCSEQIQDEAVKCRFCNEWLDKKSHSGIGQAISTMETFFRDKLKGYQEKKQAHLYLPTFDRPLIIKNIKFFSDRLTYDENIYIYSKIKEVFYLPSSNSTIIGTSRAITFAIGGVNEKDQQIYSLTLASDIMPSILGSTINKQELEQLAIAFDLISRYSFKERVLAYVNMLSEKGYFWYNDNKFYTNGDIINRKEKVLANLGVEFKQGNVALGTIWSNRKQSTTNPFEFSIDSGAPKFKLFGFESGTKLNFDAVINHDVFKFLTSHFQQHDCYPSN